MNKKSTETLKSSLQEMIDKMMDDSNFVDIDQAKVMVARAEQVQKLAAARVEADRVMVESRRVVVQAMEVSARLNKGEGYAKELLGIE